MGPSRRSRTLVSTTRTCGLCLPVKAVRVHASGGPEVLKYEEVPEPVPGPLETVVKIDAAGVNFVDVYQRTGRYPTTPPYILGQEAAGTVAAVGSEVRDVRPGDRVAYASVLGGRYAEYAVVPAERLVALPDGVSTRHGAAAMLQGMTDTTSPAAPIHSRPVIPVWSTRRPVVWDCCSARSRSCAARGSSARYRLKPRPSSRARQARTKSSSIPSTTSRPKSCVSPAAQGSG